MVDALHLQQVQRGPDVGRRPLLAGVRDQVQAQLAAAREDARELLGRVADLAGVEADADELVAKRQRLLQRVERFGSRSRDGAGSTGSVRRVHAQLRAAPAAQARCRPLITVAMGTPRAVCVCGSKKISACTHVVGRGALQVGPGHVVEVLLLQQHAGAGVVDVQEALQVGEGVGAAQLLDAGVRQSSRRCAPPARRSVRAPASLRCGCAVRPWACGAAARAGAARECCRRCWSWLTPEGERPPAGGPSAERWKPIFFRPRPAPCLRRP